MMTELVNSDLSWTLSEDLQVFVIPDHLKKKLQKKGFLDLYRFFLIMEHYISVIGNRRFEFRSMCQRQSENAYSSAV